MLLLGELTTYPYKLRPQFFLRPGDAPAPTAPPGYAYACLTTDGSLRRRRSNCIFAKKKRHFDDEVDCVDVLLINAEIKMELGYVWKSDVASKLKRR